MTSRTNVAFRCQVGIGLAHELDRGVDELRRDELLDAEPVRVAHRAPDESTQHVAPSLVRREDTVAHEEADRTGVVGHDPQAHVGRLVGAVPRTRESLCHVDQRRQCVGLEHRRHVLQQHEVALEARTGVDVLARQVAERAVRPPVELHEHEVPELEVALVVAVRGTSLMAERRAPVVVELAVRAHTDRGRPSASPRSCPRHRVVARAPPACR